jgi:virE N-domain protein
MSIFDVKCSVYRSAKDRIGTGDMTIAEFLLGERWKDPVLRLRDMVAEYGPLEAKKHEDYKLTKQQLPGATLSGLFSRRKGDCLIQHTGFVAIDIDLGDNTSIGNFGTILRTLRHRAEVAMYMRSCSGTGYFALIPLAYPEHHKEQFRALQKEYAAMGIVLDNACSDITRIRFASYDEHPYVNEQAIPYMGVDLGSQTLAPRAAVYGGHVDSMDSKVQAVETLVSKLEMHHIDITDSYNDWYRIGFALANLPNPIGRQMFHRVSAICKKYNPQECDKKFDTLQRPEKIGLGTFFHICEDYGITLK